jgi:hypothetical protein
MSMTRRDRIESCKTRALASPVLLVALLAMLFPPHAPAQAGCSEGNSPLDMTLTKSITPQQLIERFAAQEAKVKQARIHYSYTQDLMVQTLNGNSVDGQMHEVTTVSYDDKGKRLENVTFAEQSTLRGVQLTAEDWDDIRVFMPLILTTEDLPQYDLSYAGQQHVDDLDTYVFHIQPKKEEKNRRYFQGRVWVDNQDFEIVKLCGKSVPDRVPKKKNQPVDVRPTFVTYRQPVDGHWFPAYTRVDETLQLRIGSVRIREIIKYRDYKRTATNGAAAEP